MKNSKLIIMMIFMIILLVGCGFRNNTSKVAMGRYAEEKIELPVQVKQMDESVLTILKNPMGVIELYAINYETNQYTKYNYAQKGQWEREIPAWADKKELKDRSIYLMKYGKDNKLYAIAKNNDIAQGNVSIYEITDSNRLQKIVIKDLTLKDEIGKYPYPSDFEIMEDGDIILLDRYTGMVKVYDKESGKRLLRFEAGINGAVAATGQDIIAVNKEYNKLLVMNKQSEELTNEITINTDDDISFVGNISIGTDLFGRVFVVDKNGLSSVDKGGAIMETLISGSAASMSIPSLSIQNITKDEEDTYFVLYLDYNGTYEFIQYKYHEDLPAVPDIILTISSIEKCDIIQQASIKFQQVHPEVSIDYRIAKNGETSLELKDYIAALNSEIIAGKGADIIVSDYLPTDAYIKKDIYTDLSSVLLPMVKDNKIFGNIVNHYTTEGKIYTFPMKIAPSIYAGKTKVLRETKTMERLLEYSKISDRAIMGERLNQDQLIYSYFRLFYQDIVDSNGKLNMDKLETFLLLLKELDCYNPNLSYEQWNENSRLLEMIQNRAQLITMDLAGLENFLLLEEVSKLNYIYKTARFMYKPYVVVGINKESRNQKLAKEFITMLLSEEVQKKHVGRGLPVNQVAYSYWTNDSEKILQGGTVIDPISGSKLQFSYPATQDQINRLKAMIQNLDTPINYDEAMYQYILKESKSYLKGEKTIETAVRNIMRNVN
ncbi:carbohydrate ABC transporter substrate-binding protein [Mobilitalea sibirica]|uniref:Carbohydrate ABC transporter substrate-binding protein n=1 Tax=Mobilitalea sibirica TaxID=1462919 RepID=A0A8J7KVM2_9FIRM|nr:ABC transporter substrate-binding protein [Mobilitalea sibirica]MBH1939327.1 carbohydrate ABC transporter substrate-binding protein [Mobilitalea sibirica]